jgi:hypothetical protein
MHRVMGQCTFLFREAHPRGFMAQRKTSPPSCGSVFVKQEISARSWRPDTFCLWEELWQEVNLDEWSENFRCLKMIRRMLG